MEQEKNREEGCPPCSMVISHVMMPYHANPAGNVHGGVIMKFVDDAAFVVAVRHARRNVVTASMDSIDFHRPVHIGDLLLLKAALNYCGRSSMEIGVRVEAEHLESGRIRHIATAYLTFVALGADGRPAPVPGLAPRTPEQQRRHEEARQRRERRLARRRGD